MDKKQEIRNDLLRYRNFLELLKKSKTETENRAIRVLRFAHVNTESETYGEEIYGDEKFMDEIIKILIPMCEKKVVKIYDELEKTIT